LVLQGKNQIVLWDRIVRDENEALVKYNGGSKYQFVDQGLGLHSNNITFSLNYDVTPITGTVYSVRRKQHSLLFPSEYN
jgi:hypothetical protein